MSGHGAALPDIHVRWDRACRLIRSIHPPIDLFEDIADPRDWEALASVESKTNPRLMDNMGRLDLVPVARRVNGPGASLVMAPFVHVSPDRPGRFTTGHYGVYSAGDSEEVALREVAYHQARLMRSTKEPPGWHSRSGADCRLVPALFHLPADAGRVCSVARGWRSTASGRRAVGHICPAGKNVITRNSLPARNPKTLGTVR